MMDDLISRQAAIDAALTFFVEFLGGAFHEDDQRKLVALYEQLPSTQLDRLTDDDFETIRIHLNSYKEKLCNQKRWKEAEEYQRIIDRFMAFASAQPRKGKWIKDRDGVYHCSCCNTDYLIYEWAMKDTHYCPNCGADMRGDSNE